MAVTTSSNIKLSDVCLEIYGSSNTSGRSLMQCHNDAYPDGFNSTYNRAGLTLLDFRGYAHELAGDTEAPEFMYNGYNSGLYISDEGSNYLMCHWSVMDNVGVVSHRIAYRASGGAWQYKYEDSLNPTTGNDYDYMLTGLSASTSYEVFVRAYDAEGNYTDSTRDTRSTTASQVDFSINPAFIEVGEDSGSFTVNVTSNTSWTVSESVSWLSVSTTSGSGNGSFTVSYSDNTNTSARTDYLVVQSGGESQTCSVNQEAHTVSDSTDPQFPSNALSVSTETYQGDSINFSFNWDSATDSAGIANYEIYGGIAGDTLSHISTEPSSSNVFNVNGFGSSAYQYEFYVVAVDNNGNRGSSNTVQTNELHLNPTSRTISNNSSGFVINVDSSTSWTVSDNVSWISSPTATRSGDYNLTIPTQNNTNNSSRAATITFTTTDGRDSRTFEVTQEGAPTFYEKIMYRSSFSGTDACENWSMNENTYYINTLSLLDATVLYTDSAGTNTATSGYYSDGVRRAYWNGSSFSNHGECENPVIIGM